MNHLRLGVNIDHVATLRNARGGAHPCPIDAANNAKSAGAEGITAHLREDRRHIRDHDIERLRNEVDLPLNFEMAATEEMVKIALKTRPHAACIVPEKREELTTEGGLDAHGMYDTLEPIVKRLQDKGCRVSLFIDPVAQQIDAAAKLGARVVELHTGSYAERFPKSHESELQRLITGASHAHNSGLEVHAGHGLTFDNVTPIAAIEQIVELNIGHFLIGESIFTGLPASIAHMRQLMSAARNHAKTGS